MNMVVKRRRACSGVRARAAARAAAASTTAAAMAGRRVMCGSLALEAGRVRGAEPGGGVLGPPRAVGVVGLRGAPTAAVDGHEDVLGVGPDGHVVAGAGAGTRGVAAAPAVGQVQRLDLVGVGDDALKRRAVDVAEIAERAGVGGGGGEALQLLGALVV